MTQVQKFSLGTQSKANLAMVKPELVLLVGGAIQLTTVDFGITCGMRTYAEQRRHIANGTSKTMQSKHLIQPDGFSHAIDAVPFVNGNYQWDWQYVWPVAQAMREAAIQLWFADKIRWGGVWDSTLAQIGNSAAEIQAACEAYQHRHKGADFLDGPHYEWKG